MTVSIVKADALEFLNSQEPGSIDLIIGSPPYEKARLYLENGENLGIARDTEEWVAWMVQIFKASLRACNGLVAYVVEGQTKDYKYSCGPALLMADLHRQGVCLRKTVVFKRNGIPGSGGPDFLRNDWEWIICATNGGKLPWSENTACGHKCGTPPGGAMSNRTVDGKRRNQRTGVRLSRGRPVTNIANPGNIINCVVGGGQMGSKLAHENEAPFPEKIPEFFIRSFCPPGGLVCDPFSGSGTTAAVAFRYDRNFTGCDLRQSQVDLGLKRVAEETPMALFAE
jgi:site-specific DNA-methyltransferase (adenine-specific)